MLDNISWKQEAYKEKSDHMDYKVNLRDALKFIDGVKKNLPKFMSVEICDSHGLKKSLLTICFIPEKKSKMGNYISPVCLHQNNYNFKKEMEEVFNILYKMCQDYIKSLEKQLDMFEVA